MEVRRAASVDVCARLLAYWDTLPGRQEPTQLGYGAFGSGEPDFPAPLRLERHGGYERGRERARALRRERRRFEPAAEPTRHKADR